MSGKKVHSSPDAPAAIGPYSGATSFNGTLFVSGQLGLDPKTMQLVEGVEAQAMQALENLGAMLKAGGSDYSKVLKTTVLLADMEDFAKVNAVYATYFPSDPPARVAYAVKTLPKNALVEIDAIAHN